MSGLNYLKLGSTLSNICNTTQLDNATTPSKISGENPASANVFNSDISKFLSFGMEVWSFEIHQGFFFMGREWPRGRQVGKKCINMGENLLSDI